MSLKLENKNLVLKPRGPVRGSLTPSGARRALDLAEVSLPLGRSLWGLLVLLISNHDRSASVQPELLSFLFFYLPLPFPLMLFFFSHCCCSLSVPLISLLSGPYLLLSFIHFSTPLSPFFLLLLLLLSCSLSVGSVVWLRVSYEGAAAGGGHRAS